MGITATPQNAALAALSRALRSARDTGDKVDLPLLGGLGSLFLGKSPEELEEWSYGNAPMHVAPMTRVPQVKQGRKQQLADTAFLGLDASPLAAAATRTVKAVPAALRHGAESFALAQSPAHVVKPKGGNWLSGSVEDALKGLRQQGYNDVNPEVDSLNRFIEGPLTKYVKTRMASPDDEVRKLAEQGVLHFEPAVIRERSPLMEKIIGRRETAGFPIQGLGDTPLARNWENASDSIVRNLEARDLSSAERAASFGGKSGIPGDTIVHEMNQFASGAGISDLGFPHLIDELSNALNPNSGLPRNLQLTPEAMQNLSMEKAVRRVAEINAWRAAQKVEANRKLAEQASIVRDYPHSDAAPNPKGLRWVELKAGDLDQSKLPENYTLREINPTGRGSFWAGEDVRTPGLYYGHGATPEEGLASFWKKYPANKERDALRQALQDQLKYEGDTMGHCVGGYCDDVLSGRSRIFSLRDAKGEPHVTIETRNYDPEDLAYNHDFWAREDVRAAIEGLDPTSDEFNRAVDAIAKKDHPRPSIVQIKGKQNRAPNEEYLPFVQDFVRNSPLGGQWSDVGDLQNAGLTKHSTGKYVSDAEANALAAKHFGDVKMGNKPDDIENPWQYANRIRRYDPDMLSDTDKAFLADWEAGNFAQGGPVAPSETNQGIIPASWDVFFTE